MKVTVEKDDKTVEVFQNVTDCYLAVRYEKIVAHAFAGSAKTEPVVASFSWGSGRLRDIVKEVAQSLVELQDFLRENRNGGSS